MLIFWGEMNSVFCSIWIFFNGETPLILRESLDLSAWRFGCFYWEFSGCDFPSQRIRRECGWKMCFDFFPFSQREFLCLGEIVPALSAPWKITELADLANKMLLFCCPSAKIPVLVTWEESGVTRVKPQPWVR